MGAVVVIWLKSSILHGDSTIVQWCIVEPVDANLETLDSSKYWISLCVFFHGMKLGFVLLLKLTRAINALHCEIRDFVFVVVGFGLNMVLNQKLIGENCVLNTNPRFVFLVLAENLHPLSLERTFPVFVLGIPAKEKPSFQINSQSSEDTQVGYISHK